MSDSTCFLCKVCNSNLPICEKVNKNNKCKQCYRNIKKEYREKNKTGIQLQKQVYNMINKDKIKENKREYNMKKRNEKYGYTEDKIKEINEQWENLQAGVKEFCMKHNYPVFYAKCVTVIYQYVKR